MNALNCKNSFVSRSWVRQTDERSTEMINDKSGDPLLDLRKRTWRAHEKKDCFSNLKKRPEAGNYPIKFFRATKKRRFTLFILVYTLNDSFVLIVFINQIFIILSTLLLTTILTTAY